MNYFLKNITMHLGSCYFIFEHIANHGVESKMNNLLIISRKDGSLETIRFSPRIQSRV